VHIPIPLDKQWILIVANFMDKSFDVLNPDYSIEKFSSIIRIVTFNFKQLFISCYPGCLLNIRDFEVIHVKVPKHNFRYWRILVSFLVFSFFMIFFHNSYTVSKFLLVAFELISDMILGFLLSSSLDGTMVLK
jgi:hypothetical protein